MKRMQITYTDCRSFVCYRSKQNVFTGRNCASENVAGLIWWWISKAENSSFYPALFQETYHEGDLTYEKEGIKKFMPNIKKIFITIRPGFFEEIIDQYHTELDHLCNEEYTMQEVQEKALQAVKTWLDENTHFNIYYFELKCALQLLDAGMIHPVMISCGGVSPEISPHNMRILEGVFGDKFATVFSTVNNRINFSYDEIDAFFSAERFDWRNLTQNHRENDIEVFINNLEKTVPAVTKFKNDILNKIANQNPRRTSADTAINKNEKIERIKKDLKRCATTITTTQQPEKDGDEHYFSAANPNIIYDPVRIRHTDAPPPFLALCLVEKFNECYKNFKLSSKHFGFWNVDLGQEELDDGISVCAVCFGALVTQHRIKKDSAVLNDAGATNIEELFGVRDAALNLLIALRNPYTKTWPSRWVFDSADVDVEGTVNQTTLSLSTLLSCGFLSVKDNSDMDDETLKNRCEFIWESIESLLQGGQKVPWYGHYNELRGWCHKIEAEKNDPISLAFTVFVFDTLFKLKRNLLDLKEHFSDSGYKEILEQRVCEVDSNLDSIFNYFKTVQTPNGSFSRLMDEDSEEQGSVTHTAYVIKSLFEFLDESSYSNKTLDDAISYLLGRVEEMMSSDSFDFSEWERFEIDRDDTSGAEQYEHCAELIVAETLIKIAEKKDKYFDRAITCLEWMMDKFCGESERFYRKYNQIFIKGAQEHLTYPIFYIYYYRMVLMDYLLLTESVGKDE